MQIRGRDRIAPEDYQLVLATLSRFALGFGLSRSDAEELAAEALAEVFVRSTDESKDPIRQPVGYLFWTTRNRVFDRHRRARARDETELRSDESGGGLGVRYYSQEDDALVRLLDSDASADQLDDALRAAAAADDMLVVRVVAAWLELAEELDKAPTSREVGPKVGVSHTSVNQALRRLRTYFSR